MGLVWLSHPVLWHSSRVAGEYNSSVMTVEQIDLIQSRWHNWYTADWDYGLTTVEFFCAAIAVTFVSILSNRIRSRSTFATNNTSVLDRATATARFFTSRQFRLARFSWYSPPLSAILAVGGFFIFVMSLVLGVHPYYWPNLAMGHSMPIATRSGWISIAIMPFMIAFATKVNFIALLTGTSHEKLQVFHRWSALFMYITSLVHTFPFIVMNIRLGEMQSQYQTTGWYWTGIAALIPQTYLVFLSWGIFRNRYYELFKKLHFVAAGIFMAALFIHVNFRLSSWDYFWATLALYALSWLIRVIRTHFHSGLGLEATIQTLPDRLVKVSIQTPKKLKWTPGQHVFVRFLSQGMHAFSSHPFTIASLPKDNTESEMTLIFRVHGGITRSLAERVQEKTGVKARVLVDGPYGGIPLSLRQFDRVYLFAGGSGVTFTLPVLLDLVEGFKSGMRCGRVEFVLSVTNEEFLSWIEDDLDFVRNALNATQAVIRIHITGTESKSHSPVFEKQDIEDQGIYYGRPDFSSIVHQACRINTGRLAFVACGPDSLLYDVRNAVAECQLVITDGFSRCKDVFLHTENYSW